MTLAPDEVTAGDIGNLRRAGVSDDAIQDAVRVCVMFNVMTRASRALHYEPLPPAADRRVAKDFLLRVGYVLPRPLLWLTRRRMRRQRSEAPSWTAYSL